MTDTSSSAESDFVYEEGEAIDVGSHGAHDFVFVEDRPVTDTGVSDFVFEADTGIGGAPIFYDVSDWSGTYDVAGIDRVPKAICVETGGENLSREQEQTDYEGPWKVAEGGSLTYEAQFEDNFGSGTEEWNDCYLDWDEGNLESDGYIRVTIRAGSAADDHDWYLGENTTDGYHIGKHDGDNYAKGSIIWEGRMYKSGIVTDRGGAELGSWA